MQKGRKKEKDMKEGRKGYEGRHRKKYEERREGRKEGKDMKE